ncbi:MAG: hypothetical protein QOH70_4161 [Blastocatellia bacterium]|jgi:hypothetical protein|nr:hypothetical protein [Blastocatellia bacterium]
MQPQKYGLESTEMSSPNYVAPKVFISYSWTSDEYADWVKNLAEKLRSNSVDVVLDRWRLRPGQDKYAFMEQMVTDSEIKKVLVMCDKRYAERADRREGGVGTESTIISQEVYNQVDQEKFIPLITERGPNGEVYLPLFIKSRIYIDLSDPNLFERGFEDLLRTLTGRPASEEPPLGKPPAYLFETNRPTSPTTFALRAFESALMNDRRHSTGMARDYLDRLFGALAAFQIDVGSAKDKGERDTLMMKRLEDWTSFRDEWISFLHIACRYGVDARLFDAIPLFFESTLKLTRGLREPPWNQHLDFIVHEAFLYAVTVFLQEQHFDAAASLLNFHYRDPEQRGALQRCGIFVRGDTRYLENLLNEMWSKQEKGTRYKYPQQVWLHRRADERLISFELLKEADMILWLRYELERDPNELISFLHWSPVTIGELYEYEWRVDNFPLFQRATSRRFFDQFKVVLGVGSKDEFVQRWNRAFPKASERNGDGLGRYGEQVFNIERLASTE